MTPNALENVISCCEVVRNLTKAMAPARLLCCFGTPQQLVNDSVACVPAGPAGNGTTLNLTFG